MRCIWPPDSVAIGAILETGEADTRERMLDRVAQLAVDAAEQTGTAPQPHRHHVVDIDRKAAIDLGGLRQISDVARLQSAALDRAGQRLEHAGDALEQGRFAGAVRPDHRHQRAGGDRAVEMMHRRVAVVTERQIAKLQRRRHHAIAHNTAVQMSGDQKRRAGKSLPPGQPQD